MGAGTDGNIVTNCPVMNGHAVLSRYREFLERIPPECRGEGLIPGTVEGLTVRDPDAVLRASGRGESIIFLPGPEHREEDLITCWGVADATVITKPFAGARAWPRVFGRPSVYLSGGDIEEGSWLTVDGTSGAVFSQRIAEYLGQVRQALMDSVTDLEAVSVWTTAVDPAEIAQAVSAGAEGVGMFRSEMIYQEEPFHSLLKRLLLGKIPSTGNRWVEMETARMVDVLKAAGEKPFYFRLLDVAAHEYLDAASLVEMGKMEVNPMLGRRGCRLGLIRPEIYRGQVRALAQAWKACGERAPLGLVIPGVSGPEEIDAVSDLVKPILKSEGVLDKISIGVMIETPRAALQAGELAHQVESVHFGTNDLTQATYALSRDDADQVVDPYIQEGIWNADPFHQIDEAGVGRLVEMALEEMGAIRKGLWHTWCGEQATHPLAITWAHRVGLRSVSVPALWVEAVRFRSALEALSHS